MAVNLSPYGGVGAQFLDNSGNVLTGGKIYTYQAGTTTPQPTYTSANGATPHPNPIILDAAGRVPSGEIWLTDGLVYKFILRDANDVLIATYDGVSGINSNFVAFTNQQEIQTATAGQTVFNLTTMSYQPGTNSLSVFVDGVNQYGPGAQYAYLETDSDTITFVNGLHVGAEVKFTTSQLNSSVSQANAFQVSYTPPFTGSAATNVGDKLAQTVSVKDFGAVGDGIADDTAAIQAAHNASLKVYYPSGYYNVTGKISLRVGTYIVGSGAGNTVIALSAPMSNAEDAVFELLVTNFIVDQGGITVSNIFLNGLGRFGHGFYLRNVRYPVFENVWILNFDGSAIVYDYCEEGYADWLNVNGCGRTNGNPNTTADTTYGQITFEKTGSALGNNNFLRFNDCVVANGNCSGDFFVKAAFASRIYLENIQSEVSGGAIGNRDWLAANGNGSIFFVSGCDVDGYRNVLSDVQNTEIYATNMRCASTNFLTGANGTAGATISNCSGGNITTTSISGGYCIQGSSFNEITLNFIAGANIIDGCFANKLSIADIGANGKLIVSDCNISNDFESTVNVAIPIRASNVIVGGDLTIDSSGGIFVDTVTTGTVSVQPDNYYQPTQYRNIQIISGSAAPVSGYWKVGSIVYNTVPSAGGNIGWVCVTEGSPGTWKTFGAIAA